MDLTPSDLGLPSHFPSFRPGQLETAVEIASSSKRFSLLSAQTGAGKSLIYMAVSKLLGGDDPNFRTLILVGNKGLQHQLLKDFSSIGMVDIRGHSNFACGIRGGGDLGPMNLVTGGSKNSEAGAWSEVCRLDQTECHYLEAVERAASSPIVISNYAYWLTLERVFRPDTIGKFDLMIVDEAHGVHDSWLAKFVSFYLKHEDVEKYLGIDPVEKGQDFVVWAEEALKAVDERCQEVKKSEKEKEVRSKEGDRQLTILNGLGRSLSGLVETSRQHSIDWLIDWTRQGVQLSPPWASPYAEQYLFRNVPRVVLSSATLTRDTARHLGIQGYDFHELPSTFAPKNRPVIWIPTTRIDFRIGEGQIRLLMRKIDQFIESRIKLGRKGLIQSQSYEWSERVYSRSKWKDYMIVHGRGESREAVEEFMDSDSPRILVSPAIKEGYDFSDDLARWQIILKVPFVYAKDPVNEARAKTDKGYLTYLVAQDVLQMAGRIVRGVEDFGETVLFDDHWAYFRNKAGFPGWFKKAFRVSREIPKPLEIR